MENEFDKKGCDTSATKNYLKKNSFIKGTNLLPLIFCLKVRSFVYL